MDLDDFWKHLSSRSVANLEKVCMRRNCPICEWWAEEVVWPDRIVRQRINLYYTEVDYDT